MQNKNYILVVSIGCVFRQYGEEERICTKCGYIINGKGDVNKQIEFMINNGYPIPNCGINKKC
jgi:hypothetical protein